MHFEYILTITALYMQLGIKKDEDTEEKEEEENKDAISSKKRGLKSRTALIEAKAICFMATLVDARYKNKFFSSDDRRNKEYFSGKLEDGNLKFTHSIKCRCVF